MINITGGYFMLKKTWVIRLIIVAIIFFALGTWGLVDFIRQAGNIPEVNSLLMDEYKPGMVVDAKLDNLVISGAQSTYTKNGVEQKNKRETFYVTWIEKGGYYLVVGVLGTQNEAKMDKLLEATYSSESGYVDVDPNNYLVKGEVVLMNSELKDYTLEVYDEYIDDWISSYISTYGEEDFLNYYGMSTAEYSSAIKQDFRDSLVPYVVLEHSRGKGPAFMLIGYGMFAILGLVVLIAFLTTRNNGFKAAPVVNNGLPTQAAGLPQPTVVPSFEQWSENNEPIPPAPQQPVKEPEMESISVPQDELPQSIPQAQTAASAESTASPMDEYRQSLYERSSEFDTFPDNDKKADEAAPADSDDINKFFINE